MCAYAAANGSSVQARKALYLAADVVLATVVADHYQPYLVMLAATFFDKSMC